MQWLFGDLFLILLSLLIPSHIIFLDFFDELNLGVVTIHDELFVVGLGVENAVDVF